MKVSDLRNAQGVWTAYRLQTRTLLGDSLVSEPLFDRLHVNDDATDVVDSDSTVQRLGRGT